MGQITITIDKREYAITCDDGQEANIFKLSRILDEKAKMLTASVGLINENMMLAMVGLLLADELQDFKNGGNGQSTINLHKIDEENSKAINEQIEKLSSLVNEIK